MNQTKPEPLEERPHRLALAEHAQNKTYEDREQDDDPVKMGGVLFALQIGLP